MTDQRLQQHTERILQGGGGKQLAKLAEQKKLFVRERLRLLLDAEPQIEEIPAIPLEA